MTSAGQETQFAPGPCAACGRNPAAGFASVDGKWYCHGDYDETPTCYMRAQTNLARPKGAYQSGVARG